MKLNVLWMGVLSTLLFFGVSGCQSETTKTAEDSTDSSTPAVDLGEAEIPKPADDKKPATDSNAGPNQPKTDQTDKKSADSAKVSVNIMNWEETQKLVASHKGKVVVLDLWSTWCTPCVREFPNLVRLHQKFGKDKIACISGSCDYDGLPDEPLEKVKGPVLKFLQKQKATFDNVLFSEESEVIFEKADVASIPVVYVYGTDGKLVERFDNEDEDRFEGGEFNYEKHIIPLVEKLLAKE